VVVDSVRVASSVTVNGAGQCSYSDGLRVAFNVKKTTKHQPNTCELKIHNLSSATRAKLQGVGVPVTISAGYESNASIVFQGDSRTIDHVREGTDWVTRIRCGDGERAYQWSRISESFGPGASIADVIKSVAGSLGLNLGNLPAELAKGGFRGSLTQFAHGFTAHGKTVRELDRLLRTVGLSWSIQDGALQVLRGAEPAPGTAVLLTPETGLIGSPEHNAPDQKKHPPLLKFRSLLQPQIRCGGVVDIRSASVNGQFRVEALDTVGDTASTDWYSNGEAQPIP
jgi:hypothetical protein